MGSPCSRPCGAAWRRATAARSGGSSGASTPFFPRRRPGRTARRRVVGRSATPRRKARAAPALIRFPVSVSNFSLDGAPPDRMVELNTYSQPQRCIAMHDEAHDLAMALRGAYLTMHRKADSFFIKYGVTADQYVLLHLLARESGVTQQTLVV